MGGELGPETLVPRGWKAAWPAKHSKKDSPVAELKQSKEQTEVAEPEPTETTDRPR